ncbi:MAG: preprotein translocase subunit SecG [Opitutales bacterium]|nr:preprotein translocase subunit SecG [Opitutales bacterium]
MVNILITFLTFVLILVSIFMVLVILMQRASANAGLGSAFGGGAAESAFGAETTNILTRLTRWSAFAFFGISLVLYVLWLERSSEARRGEDAVLPTMPIPAGADSLDIPASMDPDALPPVDDDSVQTPAP